MPPDILLVLKFLHNYDNIHNPLSIHNNNRICNHLLFYQIGGLSESIVKNTNISRLSLTTCAAQYHHITSSIGMNK